VVINGVLQANFIRPKPRQNDKAEQSAVVDTKNLMEENEMAKKPMKKKKGSRGGSKG
jgi:hypothetical protein